MIKSLTGLLAALLVALTASGQKLDTTMWITNGDVKTMVRSGNTVYLGGNFTGVGPYTGNGFPNPTPGRLVIALPVAQSGPVDVLVVNKIGRTVLERTCNPAGGAGEFRVELDLSAQATGLYVIKLQTGSGVIVRSVFKR